MRTRWETERESIVGRQTGRPMDVERRRSEARGKEEKFASRLVRFGMLVSDKIAAE